ncbi:hypothetical protein PAAG_04418 [Paracoccidioides lutzii Pb01]|uniref:Alpha/beta hydrolase fold-3 domain-containing protein n=1 Tax=Paracoccidioides lutzii (strain ATCC MYA-826 / Pb01) TaxID=502779 RepID=C1H0X4_PARBA|nr:hypothetical protein PAAG_04418 [Paracoccidioides lutzii Pb01]EEH33368.2 hypothetical protein PAAG_04418 [Paracoccidioides lutzii Pb01]
MAINCATVVISVAYRLAPENSYPIPINDAWDSFLNIANNNPTTLLPKNTGSTNFYYCGHSIWQTSSCHSVSVGNSASLKTLDIPTLAVCGVVLRNPATVYGAEKQYIPPRFRDIHQSWVLELDHPRLFREEMKKVHVDPLAHPLWRDLTSLPQTFIQICGIDIFRDDVVCYAAGLDDAGVDVQSKMYEDLPHLFWLQAPQLEISRKVEQDCVDGINWIISKRQTKTPN